MIDRFRPEPIRPKGKVVTLRCQVTGVEGTYRAPHLLKQHLSTEERMGSLEPTEFSLILRGALGTADQDAMRALAALSRNGGSVTVRVEVEP